MTLGCGSGTQAEGSRVNGQGFHWGWLGVKRDLLPGTWDWILMGGWLGGTIQYDTLPDCTSTIGSTF